MFYGQNWKIKLVYAGLGSLFTIIGILLTSIYDIMIIMAVGTGGAMLVLAGHKLRCCEAEAEGDSSATAQQNRFETIQCSRLEIVDAEGTLKVALGNSEQGGFVTVADNDGELRASVYSDDCGGRVTVFGRMGKSGAVLRSDVNGGRVDVIGKNGVSKAALVTDAYGGRVAVRGTERASLRSDENGQ